jgi:hypothetical protein
LGKRHLSIDIGLYTDIPSLQIGDALAGMGYAGVGTLVILCIMEAGAFIFTRKPMDDGHHVLDVDDIVRKELLE